MMEKQKQKSPPFKQANGRTCGFKIPKKKADDWCEDVQVTSPLSRLAKSDFRNTTFRKRGYTSSYESYNKPRNMDSHAYYNSPGTCKFNRQPKVILTDIVRSDSGRQSAQKNITGSNSCNDATFQMCPISPLTSKSLPAHQALQGSSESLCLSRAELNTELHNETKSDKEKEVDAKYPEKRFSAAAKEQEHETPLNKICRDVSNTPVSSYKDIPSGTKRSSSLEQGSPNPAKAVEQECKTPIKNNVGSPKTRENTYCCKRAEHWNKKTSISPSKVPVQNAASYLQPSSSEPSSDRALDSPGSKVCSIDKVNETIEDNTKSFHDGCSADPTVANSQSSLHTNRMSRRKMHAKTTSRENPSPEPIVLSSDEEEREHEGRVTKALKEPSIEMKEDDVHEKQCPSPSNDEELMDYSATSVDTIPTSECAMLELKFLNVYVGKKKGRATDSAKLTAKCIEIPLKVALQENTCLSVDMMKLQKYGLWLTNGGDSIKSNAVIMLWIATDYVPEIEKQMGSPPRNEVSSKSNELIFLELVEPLTSKEQALMCEIMKEASMNGLPTLADMLSWEEMNSLLEALPQDECSFKANGYSVFRKRLREEDSSASSPVNPPEASKVQSSYRLMQKCKHGRYSVSVVPKEENTLKEIDRDGPLLKLFVYPPPPARGGLSVTNEDLKCLEDGTYLNDVIIDLYLKYLMLERFPKHFAEKCHIFSSFFYKCLTRKESASKGITPAMSAAQRRHQRVKTWTRKVDIFSKDFIFVPVNEYSHWYLAVICFPGLEKVVYEDGKEQNQSTKTSEVSNRGSVIVFNDPLSEEEETTEEESNSKSEVSGSSCKPEHPNTKEKHNEKLCKRPCILIFDSLNTASVQTTSHVLREYLKVEWDLKRKTLREFSRSSMRELFPKIPKQNNSTDCGLYLLQYAESFCQKPIENFHPAIHLENWFPECAIKNKREEIRDLIIQLHVQQTKKS